MPKHCAERFKMQRGLLADLSGITEINRILETLRRSIKSMVPTAMESCLLLLDPDAADYTRPLQCDLYDKPVNCISCKRNRPAVQKAIKRKKAVVARETQELVHPDGARLATGPEAAIPILDEKGGIMAVISLLAKPGRDIKGRDLLILRDTAELAGHMLKNARSHQRVTREKLRLSQELASLYQFVPRSVQGLLQKGGDMAAVAKASKDLSVLFVDIEGYTRLTQEFDQARVAALVEKVFSSLVDLVHRSGGDINETMGDGLMILFQEGAPNQCAANAVAAALDIHAASRAMSRGPARGGLSLNMGIASGEALVGASSFAGTNYTRMTYTASGSVTNLAARLSDAASGGDILMCGQTQRLVRGVWPVHYRGKVMLKGFAEPQRVYSPLPAEPAPARPQALGDDF